MKSLLLSTLSLTALISLTLAEIPPLIAKRYAADPSAHVFEGKLFLYTSHDWDSGVPSDDDGNQYAMKDYYFYSMDNIYGHKPRVRDYGLALTVEDVPWASRQLWAPDAAYMNGKYFLYFPSRDKDDIWRIGVATSHRPGGPFKADKSWIPGTFSIDPAAFTDWDHKSYLVWGGIYGGQLQCWQDKNFFNESWSGGKEPADDEPALSPQIARLSWDMHTLAEDVRDLIILAPETGEPMLAGDKERRFFEGPWIHERRGVYYLLYSTGTTHNLVYATADNPYGPYTYQDILLGPVTGWTTHGSIVKYKGQWWLFYHDSETSGIDYLRQAKAKKIWYDHEGKILMSPPK